MGTLTQELTRNEADMIVRHIVADAYEAEGYEWVEADTVAWKLAYYLNAPVDAAYVVDMISALRDLEQIEDGTNEDIKLNLARTIDNRDELRDYWESCLNCAVNSLLDAAGIRGGHILRYTNGHTVRYGK